MQRTRSAARGAVRACALGALAVAACSDAPVAHPVGVPPARVLVRTDPASARDCPYGGSVVVSGTDNNSDGVLQDAEVLTRSVVCNPAPVQPPPPIVIRLVAEPPGKNCEAGGTAVESGPDQNRNGQLDDGEVAHIDYACGELLLTRLVTEPPGPRCRTGGVEFQSGRDRDGDGVLEDAEIEARELHCGDVIVGDVAASTADDLAALAGIRVITGNLTVTAREEVHTLSLPHLEHVGGQLEIFGLQLADIALPVLQDVGGVTSIHAGDAIECPGLRRVGGLGLQAMGVSDLAAFSALTEIDGDLTISDMPSLVSIERSSLAIRGDLRIFSDGKLARVALALVDQVGFVDINDCAALQSVDISVTAQTPGGAEIGNIDLFGNPRLAQVAVGADRVASLGVNDAPLVTDLALDVARFDFDVVVFGITTPFRMALSSPSPGGVVFGGGLIISSALQAIDATAPVTVDGLCVFDKTVLPALDLRTPLRVEHGVRFSDNARLTRISPITLAGSLQLINNAQLTSASFVTPATPGELGGMVITDNPVLSDAASLASLISVHGEVDIERNAELSRLFGPSLTLVDGPVFVVDNARLTGLSLPHLQHVVSDLIVEQNAALQTLELPALTEAADELFIDSNPQLHHIALDALTHADAFGVFDNPRLPACEVLAVFAHVTSGFGQGQSGNDDAASCP
ncbi:MAG TPA: hypothetical protein VHW23_30950 [Kofleriaceae bacterium]|nr:hypothetical protein [Kofleriaceae bacterium]